MFHVMWSVRGDAPEQGAAFEAGNACFSVLTDAVQAFQERNGLENLETLKIAIPLWTFVHGTASLMQGDRLSKVSGTTEFDEMITRTTRNILIGLITDNSPKPAQSKGDPLAELRAEMHSK